MSEGETGAVDTGTPEAAEATPPAEGQGSAPEAATIPEPFAALEGDTRQHVLDKGFQTFDDVIKHSFEAEKAISSTQRVPGKDAAPEKMSEFFSQFAPEDHVEGYKFEQPEMGDNQVYDSEFADTFKSVAKEAGLHPTQAAIIHDKITSHLLATQDQQQQELADIFDKQTGVLEEKWGPKDSETYQQNVEAATNVINTMGDEFKEALISVGVMTPKGEVMNAAIIQGLVNFSSTLSQGKVDGQSSPNAAENPFFKNEQGQMSYKPDAVAKMVKTDPERLRVLATDAGLDPSRFLGQ